MYDSMLKLWLVKADTPVLSQRGAELLRAIWEQGSMDGVSSALKLPPEDVLERLEAISETLGEPLYHVGPESHDRISLTPEGEMLLTEYETRLKTTKRFLRYGPWPPLTADGILLTGEGLLLIRRGKDPFKGSWALPGGFLMLGETLEDTIVREMKEETGLDVRIEGLVGVFSDPGRDPRGQTVSAAFSLIPVSRGLEPQAGDDASECRYFPLDNLPDLAFDHSDIIAKWLGNRKQQEP